MKKRIIYLLLPLITLILEILPWGAVLLFANPEGEPWKETFSYFSLTPFGFANFAPLITALLTCVMILLLVTYCITGKLHWAGKAKITACAAGAVSFGPLVFGLRFFSFVGLLISLTLIAEFLLLHYNLETPEAHPEQ